MAEKQEDGLKNETCPVCHKKTLILSEHATEVPYFGKLFLFSMTCNECKYHQSDVEGMEKHEPAKYTLDISSEKDMKIRIVKSSQATIKIPHIITITPGPASNGFVTNVEGVLNRVKHSVETAKEQEEDPAAKKKAKNLLKKLLKITWGQEKTKLIIEDPSGNSAIISDKAVKSKLKG